MDGEVIVVAVDASKEITDYGLEWAVRNVTNAMDSLILLAVLPSNRCPPAAASQTHHSRTYQFLSSLLKKWSPGHNKESSSDPICIIKGREKDVCNRINDVCEHMMRQLCVAHSIQVYTEVKVLADAQLGSVATKAAELGASWVILDRRLKKEGDCCLKQLNCNIVLIDNAIPKLLKTDNRPTGKKFNMVDQHKTNPTVADMLGVLPTNTSDPNSVTTRSSLGIESPSSDTDESISSLSSTDKDKRKEQFHQKTPSKSKPTSSFLNLNSQNFHKEEEAQAAFRPSPSSYTKSQPINKAPSSAISYLPRKSSACRPLDGKTKSNSGPLKTTSKMNKGSSIKSTQTVPVPARRSADSPRLSQNLRNLNISEQLINGRDSLITSHKNESIVSPSSSLIDRTSSIRRVMSVSIKHPPTPPPLCSVCKYNAPIFGKSPRKFSYKEIQRATDGFSRENFLAEGGYGPVYRGVLPDGQVVAVKQHKMLSAQGASEFCSEVEVLSCAQHRNLVMLVGYCIESEWLLVYEFSCNNSLDKHLYRTETNEVMAWHNRMKVAVGAARGLRYLHEDCRVGCIVHRDFRPNNILLTHDFEPMVGDFGLARWQADGQSAEETRVIGAFGYLAPEYTQTGLITEKADVYAFGVVLLELLTAFKATEFSRNTGQQFVSDWGHPLLARKNIKEILDPRLENNYVEKEVECMMYAASLCVSPNPERRPRMSKVLKILEGDMSNDMAMAYNNGGLTSIYPNQYRNNINATQTPLDQTQNNSPSQIMQTRNDMPVPSSPSATSAVKPMTPPNEGRVVRGGVWSLNPDEKILGEEECEAYLQGSLARYIHNFNGK